MTQGKFQINSAAISDKGLSDKRPQNEDTFLMLAERGLFAVADGVGGAQAGDVASEMAAEILGEAFINLGEGGDAEDRMRAAIEKGNAAIYQMSRDLSQLSTMATTLVALHISENIATIGHVGDSRLYRLDPKGNLVCETQDHSVVADEVRAGRMTAEEAKSHPSRNVISRALGADATVEIDMKTIMFDAGTTFLVCSDGVTRHITDQEIRDILFMEDDPQEACEIIKRRCYDRGAEDNLTAVIVKVDAKASAADDDALLELDTDEVETVATARVGSSSGSLFPDISESQSGGHVVDESFELDDIPDLEVSDEIVIPQRDQTPEEEAVVEERHFVDETPLGSEQQLTEEQPIIETIEANEDDGSNGLDSYTDIKSYRVDDSASTEFIGKLLTGIVWLLVGIFVGALGYYMISNTFGDRSTLTPSDQSVLSYEKQRREVDVDPAKYIAVYSTKASKSAADHYLIGRAYLLQKNYGAAKTSFENANKQLGAEDENNRSILRHDIAAGLAIAISEEAQEGLENPAPKEDANGGEEEEPKGD